jgi:electron transfer flavoprotein alpha/beta subunit
VACAGARATTIEAVDDDEITAERRAAFTREHAFPAVVAIIVRIDAPRPTNKQMLSREAANEEQAIRIS